MECEGRSIRTLRKLRGLTQSDLGAAVGMDRQLVGKVERGERVLSDAELKAYATVLARTDEDRALLDRAASGPVIGLDTNLGSEATEGLRHHATRRESRDVELSSTAVVITEPATGDPIPAGAWRPVRGTARYMRSESKLWLLVVGEFGLLWPQQRALFVSNTEWEAWVRFGMDHSDCGKSCVVMVVTADGESQLRFEQYLEEGAAAGHRYTGLRSLPRGAEEADRIVVNLT